MSIVYYVHVLVCLCTVHTFCRVLTSNLYDDLEKLVQWSLYFTCARTIFNLIYELILITYY